MEIQKGTEVVVVIEPNWGTELWTGYDFISLETALEDDAYQSEDTSVGKAGITWIYRWAITRGMPSEFYEGEPTTPEFVSEIANTVAPD